MAGRGLNNVGLEITLDGAHVAARDGRLLTGWPSCPKVRRRLETRYDGNPVL